MQLKHVVQGGGGGVSFSALKVAWWNLEQYWVQWRCHALEVYLECDVLLPDYCGRPD